MNDESGLPEPYGKKPPQQRLTLFLEEVEEDARQLISRPLLIYCRMRRGWSCVLLYGFSAQHST